MRRRLVHALWLLLLLAAGALTLWIENRPREAEPAAQSSAFVTIRGARLVPHKDNDGDSFHLSHDGTEHEFRLYFADAPEKRLHQYNGDRIREQGRYFGGLSDSQVIAIGEKARDFTRALLQGGEFVIHTRWQRVYGSARVYAFVMFDDHGSVEDLSAKLVRAGLARIHTEGARLPDGRGESEYTAHLHALEAEARAKKKGAWAVIQP